MLAQNETNNTHHPVIKTLLNVYHFMVRQLFNMNSFGSYIEPIIQQFIPHWRHNKIAARINQIKHENNEVFTLKLSPSGKWNGFVAGQYVHISFEKEGALFTRTFSIASSPKQFSHTGEIALTIKTPVKGQLTPWMKRHLKIGDYVYLSQAEGEFILDNSQRKKVFIAGGSGLTPIHSMLRQSMQSDWFQNAELLFYVNDRESLFYQAQLERLKQAGLSIQVIYTDEAGQFNQSTLSPYLETIQDTEFYLCGPQGMIEACRDSLNALRCPQNLVHFEYFGLAPAKPLTTDDLSELADEHILVDYLDSKKQSHYKAELFVGEEGRTLLEVAEQEGLNPVSGCRMGVCHQCICKKKKGRVFNKKTGTYSDSGEEEIQLCLSIPVERVELEL